MRTKRQPTEAQKAAAAEKRARFKEFCQRVAAMSEDDRALLAARMPVVNPEGHPLSPYNTCLLISQTDTAPTIVGGFQQWRKIGRQVRKGEHGLMIWCPSGKRKPADDSKPADDENDRPGFIMGYVFDISQTDEAQPAA